MIEKYVDDWCNFLQSGPDDKIRDLMHENIVLYSPVVFKPKAGRDTVGVFLAAARQVLVHSEGADFKYIHKAFDGNRALLEFETSVDGRYVNGMDIITYNDAGLMVEFKLMVRPLQGLEAINGAMTRALRLG